MIYDLCYILNELDLLVVRFSILDKYVDYFIVVESPETFSGIKKNICFDRNDPRFAQWKEKIIHHVVDPYDAELRKIALISPCTGEGEHYWVREFTIKEGARNALKNLDNDDVVFISDLDEIWNPEIDYNPIGSEVLKPQQLPYLYYFNQRTSENWLGWTGTTVCRYETIKNGIINHIRTDDMTPYTVLEKGGWHFNSIGGKQKKIDASQHPVVNGKTDWDRREVNMRVDESDLPRFLTDNKQTWIKFFL